MTLDLRDCTFFGSALPEPFVRFDLHTHLATLGLLHHVEGKNFERNWDAVRRQLVNAGGAQRICNHVIAPLAERLRFNRPIRQDDATTREGSEDGGWLMQAPCGTRLRAWTCGGDTDLDAPARSGRAYRFSPTRCAQRVLLAKAERLGLLTNGNELRVLLCDPVHSDSYIAIPLAGGDGWRARSLAPELISPAVGARCARGYCRAARRVGCRAAEVRPGSPRICAYRHAPRSRVSYRVCSNIHRMPWSTIFTPTRMRCGTKDWY